MSIVHRVSTAYRLSILKMFIGHSALTMTFPISLKMSNNGHCALTAAN